MLASLCRMELSVELQLENVTYLNTALELHPIVLLMCTALTVLLVVIQQASAMQDNVQHMMSNANLRSVSFKNNLRLHSYIFVAVKLQVRIRRTIFVITKETQEETILEIVVRIPLHI